MKKYLEPTDLLDYNNESIQTLIKSKGWAVLSEYDAIGAVYDFVRNEIPLGFNRSDKIKASEVLTDGYGQCNTKAILAMALFRALGTPCRLHGVTVDKSLQKGLQPSIVYALAPQEIVHSWVEIFYDEGWIALEGLIVDEKYLSAIQRKFSDKAAFLGYAIATDNLQNPQLEWAGKDTFIQKNSMVRDFGVFCSPDEFLAEHSQSFSRIVDFLYVYFGRKMMNFKGKLIRR